MAIHERRGVQSVQVHQGDGVPEGGVLVPQQTARSGGKRGFAVVDRFNMEMKGQFRAVAIAIGELVLRLLMANAVDLVFNRRIAVGRSHASGPGT